MRRFALTAALILPLLCSCAANRVRDIRLESADIVSLSPSGMRSLDAVLSLKIYNPAPEINASDISGSIMLDEKKIMTFTADPFTLPGRTTAECELCIHGTLVGSINPLSLLGVLDLRNPDNVRLRRLTSDIRLDCAIKGGGRHKLEFKNLDPIDFLHGRQSPIQETNFNSEDEH